MLAEIFLVVNTVLNFFLIQESRLCLGDALDSDNVVLIHVLLLVVHVVDLVLVELLLLVLLI